LRKGKDSNERGSVTLTPPWNPDLVCKIDIPPELESSNLESFILYRTGLHETYVKEHERTKRTGMILAAVLILGAAALVLFAPQARQTLSIK
jgi:hypothetical protein